MEFLSHLLCLSGLVAVILLYCRQWRRRRNNDAAPEPAGAWPIIGHLHLLGGNIPVFSVLGGLADKIGPVFTVRVGMQRAVVVSSWEAVKECFTTNDKVLAKRPSSTAGVYLGHNYAGFVFADGPFWREIRKVVTMELLSPRRLHTLKHVRESEIATSFRELYQLVEEEVVISDWFGQLTLNIITMMIAGKRFTEKDEDARSFRNILKQIIHLSGQFIVSDAIPFPPLRWLDFQGNIKSLKRVAEELSIICEGWIDEHVERRRINNNNNNNGLGTEQDFIDVMLSAIDDKFLRFGHTPKTIIKATIVTLILGGSDTTSIHLTWLLSALLNNTRALRKAQEEIDEKVGKDRWVQESDIKNLTYVQAIVKETLRLFPPLGLPHEAMEDCWVSGYRISKGTQILVNVQKLHHDPRVWQEPNEFVPERFTTKHAEVDFSGQHHEYIPFGSGRRSCPGITVAMQVTHLTMARLLQGFEVRKASDEAIDMSEGIGLARPKATPLRVLIAPRLPPIMYQN